MKLTTLCAAILLVPTAASAQTTFCTSSADGSDEQMFGANKQILRGLRSD
jgi:hypothetical protein